MEQKVLEAFLYSKKLKFSEIEKRLGIRSNKLAYHIKNLEKKGILVKKEDYYELSEAAESLIPYLSDKKAVMVVVLVALEKNGRVFLHKRKKRPFKDKLSLPGGRLISGESISDCVKRMLKSKHGISARFKKVNSISLEHVKKAERRVHSFMLVFVSASTKDDIEYIDVENNKRKIISSDYKLIKNDLDKEVKIGKFSTSQ